MPNRHDDRKRREATGQVGMATQSFVIDILELGERVSVERPTKNEPVPQLPSREAQAPSEATRRFHTIVCR
jgi:hypothetical protein